LSLVLLDYILFWNCYEVIDYLVTNHCICISLLVQMVGLFDYQEQVLCDGRK